MSAALHDLSCDLAARIMQELPLADRARFAMSCKLGLAWWESYPFSCDDYGSTIPHRYTKEPRSSRDWMTLIRDRATSGPSISRVSIRCSLDPRRGCEGTAQATMTLAQLAHSPRDRNGWYPEQDPRLWTIYESALLCLKRGKEAQQFSEKIAPLQDMSAAMTRRDGGSVLRLAADGVPIGSFASLSKEFAWGRPNRDAGTIWFLDELHRSQQLRYFLTTQLVQAEEHNNLHDWFAMLWNSGGPLTEIICALPALPVNFFPLCDCINYCSEIKQQDWTSYMWHYIDNVFDNRRADFLTARTEYNLEVGLKKNWLAVEEPKYTMFLQRYLSLIQPRDHFCLAVVRAVFVRLESLPNGRERVDEPGCEPASLRLNPTYQRLLRVHAEAAEICRDKSRLAQIYRSTAMKMGHTSLDAYRTGLFLAWFEDIDFPFEPARGIGEDAAHRP